MTEKNRIGKRLLAAVTLLALATVLAGCGGEKEPQTTPAPEETPGAYTVRFGDSEISTDDSDIFVYPDEYVPEDTDTEPEDAQEPFPQEESADMKVSYLPLTNAKLQIRFGYPSDWILEPGVDTITYVEPVEEGDVPARFSVTSFTYPEKSLSAARLKNHLKDYLKKIFDGANYNDYRIENNSYGGSFLGTKGMRATYIAVKGNAYIKGYVVVGYAKNGRVYCVHFCCDRDDYETFSPMVAKMISYVSVWNEED